MVPRSVANERGFGLTEVLIAAGILIVVAAGVSQVAPMAEQAAFRAHHRTIATYSAVARMADLRSGPWPAHSPPGTLDANMPPFVDYVNARGERVGDGAVPPPGAVFARRWAVRPLATDPDRTVILQVVTTEAWRTGRTRRFDDGEIVAVRTRRSQ